MNEVYLRDGSRKVRDVLRSKRESGQYCACPPYGYRKDQENKHRLAPDELTAPVVERIFRRAAAGDSSRKIALDLNADGIIPPLKYRVLYRDEFSEEGAARASDVWNYTTVKRILKNQVYLGHTLLGKSRKVSVKSQKKTAVPKADWAVTRDTHPPLVDKALFQRAQENLGRGSRDYRAYGHVRKIIFGGVAVCGKCGHSLCSCGTVYKGEREKYWYLSCTHQRQDIAAPCEGVRIRYTDLMELVRQDLNSLLAMSEAEITNLVNEVIRRRFHEGNPETKKLRREKAEARLTAIDRIVTKLYNDNGEGRLDDDRLDRMVDELEKESTELKALLETLKAPTQVVETEEQFARFFAMAQKYTHLDTLDRDALLTFVERVEVGPKEYADGRPKGPRSREPYRQSVRIVYKFIGDLNEDQELFPQEGEGTPRDSHVPASS